MFNLLQLFLKLSSFLLFIVLEIFCFSLIVKYNQQQNEVYANTVIAVFQSRGRDSVGFDSEHLRQS